MHSSACKGFVNVAVSKPHVTEDKSTVSALAADRHILEALKNPMGTGDIPPVGEIVDDRPSFALKASSQCMPSIRCQIYIACLVIDYPLPSLPG